MNKIIKQGDTFEIKDRDGNTARFVRETDDPNPPFESERIRVTHLSSSNSPNLKAYTFGTEPEWFRQRGLEAAQ